MFIRPLLFCAGSLAAGICFCLYVPATILSVFLTAACLFAAALFFLHQKERRKALFILLFVCFFMTGYFRTQQQKQLYDTLDQTQSAQVVLTGRVDKTESRADRLQIYLTDTLLKKEGRGKRQKSGTMLVSLPVEMQDTYCLRAGNQVRVEGVFYPLAQARNYGNFEERTYYHSLGIAGRIRAETLAVTDRSYQVLKHQLQVLQERLSDKLKEAAGEKAGGIFSAIVAGDKSGLDRQTKQLYRKTGIVHVLAISGLHISLIGMGLFRALRKKLPYLPAALLSGILMFLFLLMTGASVSVIRATVMFYIFLAAKGLGKSYDLLNALSVSALILLIMQPYSITNPAFLLSFGAVFAIGTLARCFQAFFRLQKKRRALFVSVFQSVCLHFRLWLPCIMRFPFMQFS